MAALQQALDKALDKVQEACKYVLYSIRCCGRRKEQRQALFYVRFDSVACTRFLSFLLFVLPHHHLLLLILFLLYFFFLLLSLFPPPFFLFFSSSSSCSFLLRGDQVRGDAAGGAGAGAAAGHVGAVPGQPARAAAGAGGRPHPRRVCRHPGREQGPRDAGPVRMV